MPDSPQLSSVESGTRVVKSVSGLLTAAEEFPVAELEETAVPELETAAELELAAPELESGFLLELEKTAAELDCALELEESPFALVESSEQAAKAASATGRMYFVIFMCVKLFQKKHSGNGEGPETHKRVIQEAEF